MIGLYIYIYIYIFFFSRLIVFVFFFPQRFCLLVYFSCSTSLFLSTILLVEKYYVVCIIFNTRWKEITRRYGDIYIRGVQKKITISDESQE